jgi:integrase
LRTGPTLQVIEAWSIRLEEEKVMNPFRKRTSIGQFTDEFAERIHSRSNGTKKSWRTDTNRLRAAVDLLGVKYVEDISLKVVAAALSAKEDEGRSPKTINSYREILHRFCEFALREKGISFRETARENPVARVPKRREHAPEITYLDLTQVDELLSGLSSTPRIRAMAAVLIYAGLRRGELLHLTKRDVDLGRRLIHVRAQTIDGIRWQPKTGRNRSVPVSDRLLAELTRWVGPGGPTWYFPSPEGRFWDPDNFSKTIRRAQEQLSTSWNCLDFRHTFGTQLARRGVSLYKIATLMGNSPAICRKHYAFLLSDELKEEVEFGHSDPVTGGSAGARREDSSGSRRREGDSGQAQATA